jgi:hypothetical protein
MEVSFGKLTFAEPRSRWSTFARVFLPTPCAVEMRRRPYRIRTAGRAIRVASHFFTSARSPSSGTRWPGYSSQGQHFLPEAHAAGLIDIEAALSVDDHGSRLVARIVDQPIMLTLDPAQQLPAVSVLASENGATSALNSSAE